MVRSTLDRMADGGIRDQLGGGFHRYATDADWLVPHFEQMLYDNAQLARVYLHAWSVLDDAEVSRRRDRDARLPAPRVDSDDGAFAASQDADTDGIEGLTFTWRAAEIREVLGDAAPAFDGGLRRHRRRQLGGRDDPVARAAARRTPQPKRTSPTGALARSSSVAVRGPSPPATTRPSRHGTGWRSPRSPMRAVCSGSERYTAAAIARRRDDHRRACSAADGSLGRSWKDGRSVGDGVLEDYAHLAEGLLALYEATFDERWFSIARGLADRILAKFEDPAGGFFDTADDHERLVTRPKDPQDNAVPSGAAMATTVLLRLAAWTARAAYRDAAERAIGTVAGYVSRYPTGFGQWLCAMTFAAADAVEVAVVGDPSDAADADLIEPVWARWRPNQVLALSPNDGAASTSAVPLLHDRIARDGQATAYVCRGFVCELPVTTAEALGQRLGSMMAARARPEPAVPRPAATVVLIRPGVAGIEVLLTSRPSSMAFAADAHVFPGGRVDVDDADPSLLARAGVGATDHDIAAIRELFEEAGVLLATGGSREERRIVRSRLVRGETTFRASAEALDLRLDTSALVPLSRWVTPAGMPRRFDARFYVAELPADAEVSIEGGEVVEAAWFAPRAALDAMSRGDLSMWLPTSSTIQQLEFVRSIDDVRSGLAPGRQARSWSTR